jgi:putative transposase
VIYIEDLNISGMVKNHHLAKSINDASWSKFFELLFYKAEEAGRKVVKVPRFEPTSKTCSECGAINHELTLADRQWVFKSCETSHNRDYNAAKNIHRVGQTLQEQTYDTGQSVS